MTTTFNNNYYDNGTRMNQVKTNNINSTVSYSYDYDTTHYGLMASS